MGPCAPSLFLGPFVLVPRPCRRAPRTSTWRWRGVLLSAGIRLFSFYGPTPVLFFPLDASPFSSAQLSGISVFPPPISWTFAVRCFLSNALEFHCAEISCALAVPWFFTLEVHFPFRAGSWDRLSDFGSTNPTQWREMRFFLIGRFFLAIPFPPTNSFSVWSFFVPMHICTWRPSRAGLNVFLYNVVLLDGGLFFSSPVCSTFPPDAMV